MQPALKERYTQVGHIPVGSTPEQLEKFIREDMERWARVAAQIKLQPE
jgi:tripartite-type tricarboxylate transporter receptor subunit TctC